MQKGIKKQIETGVMTTGYTINSDSAHSKGGDSLPLSDIWPVDGEDLLFSQSQSELLGRQPKSQLADMQAKDVFDPDRHFMSMFYVI